MTNDVSEAHSKVYTFLSATAFHQLKILFREDLSLLREDATLLASFECALRLNCADLVNSSTRRK